MTAVAATLPPAVPAGGCSRAPPEATGLARPPATADAYRRIRGRIGRDPAGRMTAWNMSFDHLFVGGDDLEDPDSLREQCRRFVRSDGGLDLLFSTLLAPAASDADVLAVAQILVFWAEDEQPGDPARSSRLSRPVLEAADAGRFEKAARTYPDLPIAFYIRAAARKAMAATSPATHPAGGS